MKQIACGHVGLDCDCVMNGATEEDVMRKSIEHIWEYHAIKPEEMTSEMKVKIKENIQTFCR
jgi:predicted small metal-binding protein